MATSYLVRLLSAHPHACTVGGALPGVRRVQFEFDKGIPLYAGLAALLAGFSVALVGLLAQNIISQPMAPLSEGSQAATTEPLPATSALAALIPGVAVLVLSAYLYAEAGGETDKVTQLYLGLIAGEALAVGALATFLSFALLTRGQMPLLTTATTLVFVVVASVSTASVALGNWTEYRLLYETGLSRHFWGQLALYLLGFVTAAVASRRKQPDTAGQVRLVRCTALVAGILGLGGMIVLFSFGSACAETNINTARHVGHLLGWSRVGVWVVVLILSGLAFPGDRKDPHQPRPFVPSGGGDLEANVR